MSWHLGVEIMLMCIYVHCYTSFCFIQYVVSYAHTMYVCLCVYDTSIYTCNLHNILGRISSFRWLVILCTSWQLMWLNVLFWRHFLKKRPFLLKKYRVYFEQYFYTYVSVCVYVFSAFSCPFVVTHVERINFLSLFLLNSHAFMNRIFLFLFHANVEFQIPDGSLSWRYEYVCKWMYIHTWPPLYLLYIKRYSIRKGNLWSLLFLCMCPR